MSAELWVAEFGRIAERAHQVINDCDLSWQDKYEILYDTNISIRANEISRKLTGHPLDYYNPDTSYQEDSEAFVSAIHKTLKELQESLVTPNYDNTNYDRETRAAMKKAFYQRDI